ncbi:glutaminyl-peptide cyclotransferase [Paracoccus sp. MA]|uniref:outer membrane protein assembly factor BamB family protein n=1 Tax=Paracoccus sp. MA TaxID=2895796 RepID=UPI001E3BF972|nr:PQQ-binding-like beta-propeller repeat protein [Paracoccus sp. MA]UFM65996.1 glutaminyl-peptide cyclotransferase [Paracoccus sp. MA]
MKRMAEIIREYGPFPGIEEVHGVSFDGRQVWFASGELLGALEIPADAGTAFDGRHLFQIAGPVIRKIDPESGEVLATIPAPEGGNSGLAWAEGALWVGQHRGRRIHQVDPETGKVLRSIDCDRFVTGVTWADGALWHGTWQGEESDIRRIDPATGAVLERLEMPPGTGVSGLESDGGARFFCGGGSSGTLRVVLRKADQDAT